MTKPNQPSSEPSNNIIEASTVQPHVNAARESSYPLTNVALNLGVRDQYSFRRLLIFAILLTLCFAMPLINWVRFALSSSLFSYVLLVPFISGYLAWSQRRNLKGLAPGIRWPAAILAVIGLGLLAAGQYASRWREMLQGGLSYQIISYCFLLWSGSLAVLGIQKMRLLVFPALFLAFMTPIPTSLVSLIETMLQYASADLSFAFIKLAGIPVYRSGLDFQMPGIALSVAQQCSGIRSTLVLFLCSLIAGHLFLRSAWARCILALFVIPLGIIRNAFRILVLGLLCVRVDLAYIHSPIHTKGGPVFFILSLIPFGIALLLLRRIENRARRVNRPSSDYTAS